MSTSSNRSRQRREFFSLLSLSWIALAAGASGLLGLVFRYTFPNVRFEPDLEFRIGFLDDFKEGVDETYKKTNGVWVVRAEGKLFALSNICTHLGCIPNWTPTTQTFECPCHGSGYYISGINFKGPAPRPLERYQIKKNADGSLSVNKGKVYRYEKGQWGLVGSEIQA